jgi:methionyl-tRNA formyltransferase
MKDLKVVFMGTPDFAVPVLESLIANTRVIAVVTQPDKEVGRHQKLSFSPIKEVAIKHNIKVLQPIKIRIAYQEIIDLKPDIIITCAYGQIIPKEILVNPPYGCINVHASLLPNLRGGAPIHHALIDGYTETGITIMYMDEGMDSGDIISQEVMPIEENDNVETLHDKLSMLGSQLLMKTLPSIIDGTNQRTKQDSSQVTYAYNIKREDEHLRFNTSTNNVYNQIRGLNPFPGAYTILDGKHLKIYQARKNLSHHPKTEPGTITYIYKDGIGIETLDGEIIITEIQLEGKKKTTVQDYLNGINKEMLLNKKLI